jgi:hypothetical protein
VRAVTHQARFITCADVHMNTWPRASQNFTFHAALSGYLCSPSQRSTRAQPPTCLAAPSLTHPPASGYVCICSRPALLHPALPPPSAHTLPSSGKATIRAGPIRFDERHPSRAICTRTPTRRIFATALALHLHPHPHSHPPIHPRERRMRLALIGRLTLCPPRKSKEGKGREGSGSTHPKSKSRMGGKTTTHLLRRWSVKI